MDQDVNHQFIINYFKNILSYYMKSYCVKQKKQTECVPGSERYVKAKNDRILLKCTCAQCGITKTKFVKNKNQGN